MEVTKLLISCVMMHGANDAKSFAQAQSTSDIPEL